MSGGRGRAGQWDVGARERREEEGDGRAVAEAEAEDTPVTMARAG